MIVGMGSSFYLSLYVNVLVLIFIGVRGSVGITRRKMGRENMGRTLEQKIELLDEHEQEHIEWVIDKILEVKRKRGGVN